jgi:hypothetical protein
MARLLVMILLALFLLAVAPAQAARFTSNYLPVVVSCSCFHIYVFLPCMRTGYLNGGRVVRDFHVDDADHAGGLRARIGEAPALEAAQVSAEVLHLT